LATLRRYRNVDFKGEPDAELLVLFAYLNKFHPGVVRKIAYYPGYAREFFTWATLNPIPSNQGFDGLLPAPQVSQNVTPKADEPLDLASRYHDPINDNVFHAQDLAVSLWNKNKGTFSDVDPALSDVAQDEALIKALRPYVLLA